MAQPNQPSTAAILRAAADTIEALEQRLAEETAERTYQSERCARFQGMVTEAIRLVRGMPLEIQGHGCTEYRRIRKAMQGQAQHILDTPPVQYPAVEESK